MELTGLRNGDGWCTPADIERLMEALRLPTLSVSPTLANLSKKDFVRKSLTGGRWTATPSGRTRVLELLDSVDVNTLEVSLASHPAAQLGHVPQTVLPPLLAAPRWAAGIAQLLKKHPWDTNVFCMTRFPNGEHPDDPLPRAIDAARVALRSHGLMLHLASEAIVEGDLWGNVAAYMWACRYGIALFEDRVGEGRNDNLIIEVGAMLMAGRKCALLMDDGAPSMPTDLVGQIYKRVNFANISEVQTTVGLWAQNDLGFSTSAIM